MLTRRGALRLVRGGAGTETHARVLSRNHGCCPWAVGAGGTSSKLPSAWTLAVRLLRWSDSDRPASALRAGSYNLTSVLPTAPDMAQFKQGVRSVAGKLSVFANGVMTSIQVSEMGTTVTEFDGGFVVLKMRFGPLFNC